MKKIIFIIFTNILLWTGQYWLSFTRAAAGSHVAASYQLRQELELTNRLLRQEISRRSSLEYLHHQALLLGLVPVQTDFARSHLVVARVLP